MNASNSGAEDVRVSRQRRIAVYERGLERCRNGDWQDGLVDLAFLAERGSHGDVPALCYSYLGYGLAHHRGQIKKGLRLCKHAVKLEFYQPECYLNLARTALLDDRYRRKAADAVLDGLEIDPEHPELLELRRELGARRSPIIPFLSRRNLVNRILGWIRHQLTYRKPPAPEGPPA